MMRNDGEKKKSILGNTEELIQNRELFERAHVEYAEYVQTFWVKADALMKQKNWCPVAFRDNTLLSEVERARYLTERNKLPSLSKVMAICIGLNIDPQISEDLLAAAGYNLSPLREHQAYRFVLHHYRGRVDECNDFLIDRGIKPLGSKTNL